MASVMTNTIRSKIARLADRRMWRYEYGQYVWRGETPDGNEIETTLPLDLLAEILEQIDNLPAVAWSIVHDENGEDGKMTHVDRLDDNSILALYPL